MKKGVLIVGLFLVLVSLSFVSAQPVDYCPKNIPFCADGSRGLYDYRNNCAIVCSLDLPEWVEANHVAWHDADDIKVSVGGKFYSLQNVLDGRLTSNTEWRDNEHDSSHNASEIKVEISDKFYSLENYLDAKLTTNDEWVNAVNTVWHDASEIRIALGNNQFTDLQSWIDGPSAPCPIGQTSCLVNGVQTCVSDATTCDPTTPPGDMIFRSGDIITLKEEANNKFLSVHQPRLIAMEDGVYANKNSVEGNNEKFRLRLVSGETRIINSQNDIELISLKNNNKLQVQRGGLFRNGRIHAQSPDNNPFSVRYELYQPKIVKNSGTGEINCGDIVYFQKGNEYMDIDFGTTNNYAHVGSISRFFIYNENGNCGEAPGGTPGGTGPDFITNGVDPLMVRGNAFFTLPDGQNGNDADTENYQKFCTNSEIRGDSEAGVKILLNGRLRSLGKRVGYVNDLSFNDISLREHNQYKFSCSYGNERNDQIYWVNLSRNYQLMGIGTEPHYTSANYLNGAPSTSSINGEDSFGFYVRISDEGNLKFDIQKVESCREVDIVRYDCTNSIDPRNPCIPVSDTETRCDSNVNVCPAYDITFWLTGKNWFAWDQLRCEVEDTSPVSIVTPSGSS